MSGLIRRDIQVAATTQRLVTALRGDEGGHVLGSAHAGACPVCLALADLLVAISAAAVPDERAAGIAAQKLVILKRQIDGAIQAQTSEHGVVQLNIATVRFWAALVEAALAQPETPLLVAQCGVHAYRPDADGQCQGCGGMGAESHWGHQTAQPETPDPWQPIESVKLGTRMLGCWKGYPLVQIVCVDYDGVWLESNSQRSTAAPDRVMPLPEPWQGKEPKARGFT